MCTKEFVKFALTDHTGTEFFAPKISGNSRSRRLQELNSDAYFHLNFEFSAFGSDFNFILKRSPSAYVTPTATVIGSSRSHVVIAYTNGHTLIYISQISSKAPMYRTKKIQ